ncbi:hypothetical protein PR202_gb10907 [Eleusine coracana subsp. coracana]|uniref:Mitochondrial import inner membrane translocase subunit TIM50 n=1 Tax=Eleusine coracana subsp. coracana TaxID=191504 RepID=A0AAV5ELN0_ELECO|nr:hypothetical protein PR202_gb10907 [Eleusine coracana subsp. coracana]
MDPPPARRDASKRRDRRRRRRRRRAAAAAEATGPGSDVLAAERGSTEQGNAAAAASSSSSRRRNRRRRRRRRDRAAKTAAEASKSPEAHVSDIVSIQGGGRSLEADLAHSSVSLPQTTTKKIVNSNETKRNFQAENKTTTVYSLDDAASYSLSRENFVGGIEALRAKFFEQFDVRSRCDNSSASGNANTDLNDQNEEPECPVMRKTNLSENSEGTSLNCSSLQKSEEHMENGNGASIYSSISNEEKKKRKKRKGRKRCDRCKEIMLQDCPLLNGSDGSGLVVTFSEENPSCLLMINSVLVDDAMTKEEESVNLDSTVTERNKLQEQDVACSENDKTSCLSPSNLAEAYVEKLKVVFAQRRSFIGVPKRKLLILDLNGLLADINQDYHNAHMADAKDMSKCTFTGCKTLENKHKPLMLKELRKLWNKEEPDLPWEEGAYSPSNTLLVDDSPYKALLNPPHTAIFPRVYSYLNWNDNSLGPGGDLRVYLQNLAATGDVESYVRNNPFGQPFITESDPHWNFYAQIADKKNAAADEGAVPLTCYA